MKIASWNVNSLKVRLEHVLDWCESAQPDLLALQETKLKDENFPLDAIISAGMRVVYSGQPTYNGVAIIGRQVAKDVVTDPPGVPDEQRRIIAATYGDVRLINLYVVNGQAVGSEKYEYKLDWFRRVTDFVGEEMQRHTKVAVVGDFNIAPESADVHDPLAWEGRILCSELEREALQTMMALGLSDSFRAFEQPENCFSWWDYRAAAFRRGRGLRIDLMLVSQALKACCTGAGIDVAPRKLDRPSDHAPVWATFAP